MSNKDVCPSCNSYTSAIYDVLHGASDLDACPYCGLPGDAMRAVDKAARKGAEQALIDRCVAAERTAARLTERNRLLESLLAGIRERLDVFDENP